jgi:hypothetical protein
MSQMEDITTHVLRYREAARHLWNAFLCEEPQDDQAGHDWDAIKQVLFTALVLRNCGHEDCAAVLLAPDRYGFSWIEPIVHLHVVLVTEVPVMISRTPGRSGYWDHPVDRLGPEDLDLRFIDFFDFDASGHIDFHYYRVRIERSTRHAALAGHEALIDVQYARILAEPGPDRRASA